MEIWSNYEMPDFMDENGQTWRWDSTSQDYLPVGGSPDLRDRIDLDHASGGDNDLFRPDQATGGPGDANEGNLFQTKNPLREGIYASSSLEEEAKAAVAPVIQTYGGLNPLLDDLEATYAGDPEAGKRLRAVVSEYWTGDIFQWATLFNEFQRNLLQAWELEQQFRNSRVAAKPGEFYKGERITVIPGHQYAGWYPGYVVLVVTEDHYAPDDQGKPHYYAEDDYGNRFFLDSTGQVETLNGQQWEPFGELAGLLPHEEVTPQSFKVDPTDASSSGLTFPEDWSKESSYLEDFPPIWRSYANQAADEIIANEVTVGFKTPSWAEVIRHFGQLAGVKVGQMPEFGALVRTLISQLSDSTPGSLTFPEEWNREGSIKLGSEDFLPSRMNISMEEIQTVIAQLREQGHSIEIDDSKTKRNSFGLVYDGAWVWLYFSRGMLTDAETFGQNVGSGAIDELLSILGEALNADFYSEYSEEYQDWMNKEEEDEWGHLPEDYICDQFTPMDPDPDWEGDDLAAPQNYCKNCGRHKNIHFGGSGSGSYWNPDGTRKTSKVAGDIFRMGDELVGNLSYLKTPEGEIWMGKPGEHHQNIWRRQMGNEPEDDLDNYIDHGQGNIGYAIKNGVPSKWIHNDPYDLDDAAWADMELNDPELLSKAEQSLRDWMTEYGITDASQVPKDWEYSEWSGDSWGPRLAVELSEPPTLTPQMPDLNYVLDYNPEDVLDKGWTAWYDISPDCWGCEECYFRGLTWEQGRDKLIELVMEFGANDGLSSEGRERVRHTLATASPGQPIELKVAAAWRRSLEIAVRLFKGEDGRPNWPRLGATEQNVAGVCVKAKDTDRILMLQRSIEDEDDPAAGTWEFPGGHIEKDEGLFNGAKREWEEEVGVKLPEGERAGHVDNGKYRLFFYTIPEEKSIEIFERNVVNPDDPDGDNSEALAWWEPEDARRNPALREEVKKMHWAQIKTAKSWPGAGWSRIPFVVFSDGSYKIGEPGDEHWLLATTISPDDPYSYVSDDWGQGEFMLDHDAQEYCSHFPDNDRSFDLDSDYAGEWPRIKREVTDQILSQYPDYKPWGGYKETSLDPEPGMQIWFWWDSTWHEGWIEYAGLQGVIIGTRDRELPAEISMDWDYHMTNGPKAGQELPWQSLPPEGPPPQALENWPVLPGNYPRGDGTFYDDDPADTTPGDLTFPPDWDDYIPL
ncbi:MAG: NUDIX domain-containing protein [Patescibacteria group bacterium]|nr:NUDIX domain-containing protein [Patescibacteria group bacterium]